MPETNIRVLPPEEAKRIAAGEVVDRPAALVREFLDNAIDSGAVNIEVTIEEGGCKKVEVADDGCGMARDDLELCSLPHATSKIRRLDDLDTALTLGFRGEALAAAAAVSRLEIISSTDGREAWRLTNTLEQSRRTRGSTVRALNLFESIPARKRFLKREGSEANLCRQAFIDKALAFHNINFRFIQDGKLRDFFPAVNSRKPRFAGCLLQPREDAFLHEIAVSGTGFTATVVIGGSELYRADRRLLYVFANGRRIQDYSLLQAMEYGVQGWFPNGVHPVGALYINIDPALADFNIHPAKREVRFRDPGAIHHAVSSALRNFFRSRLPQTDNNFTVNTGNFFTNSYAQTYDNSKENTAAQSKITAENLLQNRSNFTVHETQPAYGQMRYVGRAFNLFIIIEWGQRLYIIDQHAAHERILYDKFLSRPIPKQELILPIPFQTESEQEDFFLETKRDELSALGIEITRDGGAWRIDALPADWRMADAATVKEILDLRSAGEDMAKRWAATCCCRAAVKDGDFLDENAAFDLGKEALALPEPRCPHGRPIWSEISSEALFRAVRRE
jgi:DNA mismatch repair protein MutL